MHISRKVRIVLVTLVLMLITGSLVVWISLPGVVRWCIGYHQRSVTRELAAWGPTVATISNDASALHAAEMLGYMSGYYVPGPGYQGPVEVEASLQRQRQKSIELVVESLQRYTGLDYGTNATSWTEWAAAQINSEPDGVGSGSQPVRSETNSTTSAASSRR